MMLQITSPYFCAGVIIKEKTAPILKYMLDWNENRIRFYCSQKNWKVEEIEDNGQEIY